MNNVINIPIDNGKVSAGEFKVKLVRLLMNRRSRTMKENNLSRFTTKELVEELSRREGIEKTIAEPYKDVQVKVNGPAIILVVID